MYENVWKCMKMYGNVWKCMKMYGNVWKCMEMYEIVSKCRKSLSKSIFNVNMEIFCIENMKQRRFFNKKSILNVFFDFICGIIETWALQIPTKLFVSIFSCLAFSFLSLRGKLFRMHQNIMLPIFRQNMRSLDIR